MVNPARVITQVVLVGTQIVGRAFIEAYRAAAQNSAKNAIGGAAAASGDLLTRQTGMTIDEAKLILNVDKMADMKEITKKYEHLFKVNDPSNGGTLFLQSKVFRAKERLDLEAKKGINDLEAPNSPPSNQ
ncbi:hypothetical protein BASA60_001416 [Batrachochytrium salamandrivorans]|nr:hypothetical protein BASA62_007850 [Batrachochytrium salamandrivorans]KAH6583532.1 hypothetical protein BASA60_001416 [Batrachochytrium salamandrivorans]KAH9250685.1 hypothetical protein BASA81_011537 [Batrachochytrium salamandrivorans]